MIKELERLKNLGAKKISEETHIPLQYIQNIIHESFEGLSRGQFLGFILILEREYNSELSKLRMKGLEYFQEQEISESNQIDIFANPPKKNNLIFLYIFIALVVVAFMVYKNFQSMSVEEISVDKIDNRAIDNAKKNIIKNSTIDTNVTKTVVLDLNKSELSRVTPAPQKIEPKQEIVLVKKELKKLAPLVIRPRKKVWIGYINTTDNISKQLVVHKILTLNPKKVWLLSLGHGNITISVDSKVKKFSSSRSVRFIYKDGTLKSLSKKEFKKLNKGHLW